MAENTDQLLEKDVQETKFRVGTLEYTKRGLFMLFVYLLWGDFCFTLMEAVFPTITPITMGNLGANALLVSLVITVIPGIFNAIICPWVSFKSDRHRGKWGRRIPFLLFPTPFVALFLVLIGLSPELGALLKSTILHNVSQAGIVLTLIAIFSIGFQYFNMFIASVYYYLFNDVVPEHYLSRFMSAFRLVGVVAGAVFNFFIFRYAESHMKWIFIGCGALYFVAFMVMCLNVKEGEYPDPPEYVDGQQGIISGLKTYFTECYNHKFYWTFFSGTAAADLIAVATPFILLMQKNYLGLTPERIGIITGAGLIATAVLLIPAGWIADKSHPLRIQVISAILLAVITPTRLIYAFHHFTPDQAYIIEFTLQMIAIPASAIYVVSSLPMYMRVLPNERFGQFCSAQAMFRSILNIGAGFILGGSLTLLGRYFVSHGMNKNYHLIYAPLWQTLCWVIAFVYLSRLLKMWKAMGGEEGYVPPTVGVNQDPDTLVFKTKL